MEDKQQMELENELRNRLEEQGLSDELGGVVYSTGESIAKGKLYVLGLNPGGTGGSRKVGDLLCAKNYEEHGLKADWGSRVKGEAPYQRRTRWLISQLLGIPNEYDQKVFDTLLTNLIFTQSANAKSLRNWDSWATKCWKVHEYLLEQVTPRFIVSIGNGPISAYSFIRSQLHNGKSVAPSERAGHGNYQLKYFDISSDATESYPHTVRVIGVPHLSWYDITSKREAKEWLKEIASA